MHASRPLRRLLAPIVRLSASAFSMPKRSRQVLSGPSPKGLYANYFEVGHTAFEIVLDFGQRYGQAARSRCHTRIVTSPVYARALLETLADAMKEYELRFGPTAK